MSTQKISLLVDPYEFKIDMNKIILSGLSIEELFVGCIIRDKKLHQLKYYTKAIGRKISHNVIDKLVLLGFFEYKSKILIEKNLRPTKKFLALFDSNVDIVDNWIDEWLNLWPRGAKSGGYYIRGDKNIARHKMKLFRSSYPEYNKEIIFRATKRYISRMATENYKYSKLSHYFIFKDGSSTLASECDQIAYENNNPVEEVSYGESEL